MTLGIAVPADNFVPDAHVDYGRTLTPEGGVELTYKDLDQRWRILIARVLLWSAASGIEGWILLRHSPLQNGWLNVALLLVVLVINWIIVSKPVEIYRTIEIRPDCMILNRAVVFWLEKMEGGLPAFQPAEDGQVLGGIYGTRFVEYLTVRRFDEFDRSPEVLASHLQEAMQQMWARPY
ncbi:MAG: hypothetical protein P4M09_06080 [Devosia sp.]|nr:hypothetical protein [Devosia sp.]